MVKLGFPYAAEGRLIKSALLRELANRQPRREPMLRYGVSMTGVALQFELGSNIKRVEAMYIFIVGRIADVECDTCLRDRGVFPFYVTVDLADGHMKYANCYWDNHECSKSHEGPSNRPRHTFSGHASLTRYVELTQERKRECSGQCFLQFDRLDGKGTPAIYAASPAGKARVGLRRPA